jgi:hypothetical protein
MVNDNKKERARVESVHEDEFSRYAAKALQVMVTREWLGQQVPAVLLLWKCVVLMRALVAGNAKP